MGGPNRHAAVLVEESRAQQAHTIELKDKHAFILDLFSGQKLNTRTQTATLRYREKERALKALSKDADVDAANYPRARKAPPMAQSEAAASRRRHVSTATCMWHGGCSSSSPAS